MAVGFRARASDLALATSDRLGTGMGRFGYAYAIQFGRREGVGMFLVRLSQNPDLRKNCHPGPRSGIHKNNAVE